MSDEQIERILGLLRAGNYVDTALRSTGIARDVFDAAIESDDELRESVERARADGEARLVAAIASAARTNWLAGAWLLERQYPERYARPVPRADEKPMPIVTTSDRLDDLADRRSARRARSNG